MLAPALGDGARAPAAMRSRSRSATVSTIERPSPLAPVRGSVPNSRANGAFDRTTRPARFTVAIAIGVVVEEAGEAHLGGALALVDVLARASD